ncbi:Fic family protein [uncultured Adlercreutzia sp.]|uniref:Fic family protein n=1 Tax=uncultured Adlercreutzia sp. TaxID=875803 RepID=UPI002600E1B9|nr:Fic family protein [uncultured Adlercreutzia sp.]
MEDGYAYERYKEPYDYEVRDRRVRAARGLQAVDGLTTSAAFDEPAQRYVEGEISATQLRDLVDDYYDQKVTRGVERYSQEADQVSARICEQLGTNGFTLSVPQLQGIHGQLFAGLMHDPYYERNFRDFNMTKKEFVLARESVEYGDCATLAADLQSALDEFAPAPFAPDGGASYTASVAALVTRLWQIHPFAEGNTRTMAVFLIKLLRSHGFSDIDNTAFEERSLNFRNALVRASYRNVPLGVAPEPKFIDEFIVCLLENRPFPYRNRDMAAAELFHAKGMLAPNEE